MSSNDRAAKARNKAFRRLARIRAEHQHYARTLDPEPLASWLANDVQENKGEWTFVWDRALRYADRWWDEQLAEVRKHLEEARGKAVIVSLDLVEAQRKVMDLEQRNASQHRTLEAAMTANRSLNKTNSDLRSELDQLKKDIVERQPIPGSMATQFTTRALDEVTEQLDASERKLHVSNMRIENLKRRLGTCEAQLNEARALTTRGTTTVFEENERLVAELHRVTSLLADAEEKVSRLKDLNNRLHVDLAVTRVQARRNNS